MAKATKTTKIAPEQDYKKELKRIQQFMKRAENRGFIWLDSPVPKQPKKITEKSVERLRKLTPDVLYKKGKYLVQETGEIITATKGRALERKKAAEKAKETRKAKTHKEKKKNKSKDKKETKPKDKKETTPKDKKETRPKNKKEAKPKNKNEPSTSNNSTNDEGVYYPSQSYIVLSMVRELIDNFMPAHYWGVAFKQKKEHDVSLLHGILNNAISEDGEDAVAHRLERVGAERINEIVSAIMYDSDGERVAYKLTEFATILNGGPLSALQADGIAEQSELSEWWERPE